MISKQIAIFKEILEKNWGISTEIATCRRKKNTIGISRICRRNVWIHCGKYF